MTDSETVTKSPAPQPVRIVDVSMPMSSMVVFMVKLAIAAVPALLILLFLGAFFMALVPALFGARHG